MVAKLAVGLKNNTVRAWVARDQLHRRAPLTRARHGISQALRYLTLRKVSAISSVCIEKHASTRNIMTFAGGRRSPSVTME